MQACDLRFGQVGLACVRVLSDDADALRNDLKRRADAAPSLLARVAVVLDLSHLGATPSDAAARSLLTAVRDAGMLPVGLAYGSSDMDALARRLDLPSIAKFRPQYEPESAAQPTPAHAPNAAHAEASETAPAAASAAPTMHHRQTVRSGQQVYAANRDLVVAAAVANGAEVIADGSIHVYGRLHGRALAGALGDENTRIYCTDFRPELVSIAGHYRVFEEIPPELEGQSVQCWLDGEKLMITRL